MKYEFRRSIRTTKDAFETLHITVEKRVSKRNAGIMQTLINIVVYVLIFVLFLRKNLQYMGMFIAFMAASVITQLILKFGGCFKRKKGFPFVEFIGEKAIYREYLKKVEKKVAAHMAEYERYLSENLFLSSQLAEMIRKRKPNLYCRLPFHEDFLTINLGKGCGPYPVELKYPTLSYHERDVVLERFRDRMEKKITNFGRKSFPLGFSLKNNQMLSVANKGLAREEFLGVINTMILNLAALQSPEELILCTIFDAEKYLEWTRFLPHVWFGDRRMVYCGSESEKEFEKLVREALNNRSKHVIAVVDVDFALTSSYYNIFNDDMLPQNLSVIFFSDKGYHPSRSKHCLNCFKKRKHLLGTYEERELVLDTIAGEECEILAKKLYNIKLADNRVVAKAVIPERVTLMELMDVNGPEDMPSASGAQMVRIQESFPIKIGVGRDGESVELDLTNDGDGNHCLVTGTNGSGKSECILTLVANACAMYSPEYLSFVAIDFKGGAMSNKICNLPHCLGTFTNDGERVSKRELTRIAQILEYEIQYRTKVMNEAGCGNNLAKYHRLYAEGKVKTALPRLLIIVDEVAVFFAKDNEASKYIADIATVGRAFGMILLLATQSRSGVIPSQVRTNINVHVEFYSEDVHEKNVQKVKGRAVIHSLRKNDCVCQVALASAYESNKASVDFLTLSGKSRLVKGTNRFSQLEEIVRECEKRYPKEIYDNILDEIITLPLEECVEYPCALSKLQDDYYDGAVFETGCYPIGILDNIYQHRRDALVYKPSYNLLVYGRPQSGKTTLVKTLLLSMFHKSHGLKPNQLNVHIAAKNSYEYEKYCFPHVGSILPEKELYYLLLYLANEIKKRRGNRIKKYKYIVAVLDDCYGSIQQSEELMQLFKFVTAESVSVGISIILTLNQKSGFGNDVLKNFSRVAAFYMGDDFDYSSLLHVDAIRKIPDIQGRCLTNMCKELGMTMEAQIMYPYSVSEDEAERLSNTYQALWIGKEAANPIPLLPEAVSFPAVKEMRSIPVGLGRDLAVAYWNMDLANTYLVSYFADADAVAFVLYLIKMFAGLGMDVIAVDNQRGSLARGGIAGNVKYFKYNDTANLTEKLESLKLSADSERKTVLVMFDYVRLLFPSGREEKELVRVVDDLIQNSKYGVYGVFADMKDFINSSRTSYTRFGQFLEGVNSGMLIGNTPSNHTFGYSGLSVNGQLKPLDNGWGVNVSPISTDTKRIKIAKEVKADE